VAGVAAAQKQARDRRERRRRRRGKRPAHPVDDTRQGHDADTSTSIEIKGRPKLVADLAGRLKGRKMAPNPPPGRRPLQVDIRV
jgi:hypothetical protein